MFFFFFFFGGGGGGCHSFFACEMHELYCMKHIVEKIEKHLDMILEGGGHTAIPAKYIGS